MFICMSDFLNVRFRCNFIGLSTEMALIFNIYVIVRNQTCQENAILEPIDDDNFLCICKEGYYMSERGECKG